MLALILSFLFLWDLLRAVPLHALVLGLAGVCCAWDPSPEDERMVTQIALGSCTLPAMGVSPGRVAGYPSSVFGACGQQMHYCLSGSVLI